MTIAPATTANVLWFLPTHGDGRYLGSSIGGRDVDLSYLRQVAEASDKLGYYGVLLPTGRSCEDSWVIASALLPQTRDLRFLVAVRPGLLSPAVAARMTATLDRISDGRLLINVVTGGDPIENKGDGIFLAHDERYAVTKEFLDIYKALLAGERVNYDGRHIKIEDGKLLFPPLQKPHPFPDHFARWLDEDEDDDDDEAEQGKDRDDNFRFATRLAFGNYLASQLQQLSVATGRLKHIHGEAVALSRSSGGIVVTLDNFRRVKGDRAVIATGYDSPGRSGMPANLSPWLHVHLGLRNSESILLLGTGLSTVDHVQSLIAAGYQGKIYALSRRGLLPKAHRPVEPAEIGASEVPPGKNLIEIFRWLRVRAQQGEERGSDWRAVFDGLRPYVQQLWQGLSHEDQSRFVRHARPWWDVRRHRMAPKVAAAIDDLLATGRLVVIAAKIVSIVPLEDGRRGIEVRYRRRGKHLIETLDVQGVTDCTGFSIDISKATNPLVRSLLEQGLGRPDRLGLGFDVDGSAALIDKHGVSAQDIVALGPLTRGAFWEITGIPDIRAQCAQLAERLTLSTAVSQTPSNARAASRQSCNSASPQRDRRRRP